MLFEPKTTVYLFQDIPFSADYKNVVNFSTKTAQESYFASKLHSSFLQVTFIRKERGIRVNANLEDLYPVNYIAYKNKDKWIYCFVTDKKYISEGNTELTLQVDVYQTYLFDITMQESFIIREHVTDDTIGANLLDEGLETGEYRIKHQEKLTDWEVLGVVIGYTIGKPNTETGVYGNLYGGIYSGLQYNYYDITDIDTINNYIKSRNAVGEIDSIAVMFMIPKAFIPGITHSNQVIPGGTAYGNSTFYFPVNTTSLDGYTPKNKKLFTHPYTFITVHNNKGGNAKYRIENFIENSPVPFKVGGNISPNPTGFCYPQNYNGVTDNWEEALTLDGFPLCSWINDGYANWLAQNKNAMLTSEIVSAGTMVGGFATGNMLMAGVGAMGVLNQLTSIMQHSTQPTQARGNTNSGSLNCATGNNTFFFSQLEIKQEYAKRIDKFFDMYGYKVNTVKVPNTNTRPYWNYVQTIDCNLKVNATMEETLILKEIFNKGVTIWHSPSNIGNYSLNNH